MPKSNRDRIETRFFSAWGSSSNPPSLGLSFELGENPCHPPTELFSGPQERLLRQPAPGISMATWGPAGRPTNSRVLPSRPEAEESVYTQEPSL